MELEYLCGVTGEILNTLFVEEEQDQSLKALFFKPYPSVTTFFQKTASVLTAPLLLGACSVTMALFTAMELFDALRKATGWISTQENHLENAYNAFLTTVVFAIAALSSPFINAIDMVGSSANSLIETSQAAFSM